MIILRERKVIGKNSQTHLISHAIQTVQYEHCNILLRWIFFVLCTTTTLRPCSNIHICLKRQTRLAFVFEVKKDGIRADSSAEYERHFKL